MAVGAGAAGPEGESAGNVTDARAASSMGNQPPEEAMGLVTFESEETLKASVKVVAECKSHGKGLTLLRDEKECYYLMAKGEDMKVSSGTQVGGVGGGHFIPYDGTKRCVQWRLPLGDKTVIQLAKGAADGDGEPESAKAAPKIITGTLYAITRDIEDAATSPPKLTSYGALIPSGSAGRHQYLFEFPEDHEMHNKMMFQPSPGALPVAGAIASDTGMHAPLCQQRNLLQMHAVPVWGPGAKEKVSASTFFQNTMNADTGVGQGALSIIWRLNHDAVGNVLKPSKPYVVTSKVINLKKGCPARVAWP